MKIAIILFNLGGPNQLSAVTPFLFNLFSDPAILRLPAFVRYPLAALIAALRSFPARRIYARIGGGSPLLTNTEAQAKALEQALNLRERRNGGTELEEEKDTLRPFGPSALRPSFKCFISMRYWHPFSAETVRALGNFVPDEILYLPLYPQYSTTTTESSFKDFDLALKKTGIEIEPRIIRDYSTLPGFIEALAQLTKTVAQSAVRPRYLFSAHGLPEKIVNAGDPYPAQCRQTAEALAKALRLSPSDWVLCYQSRVGPLKWIGPSVEEEILRAGKDKKPILIVPIAFTAENSETLYEIDMLYKELAQKHSVPGFMRAACVGTHPAFIEGLAALAEGALGLAPSTSLPDAA